jgi:Ni,Fe-hydrogenase I large subunit
LPESVFLHTIPTPREELKDQEILKDYETILKVRDDVMSAVELCRKEKEVNHPYEAEVYIWGNEEVLNVLKKYKEDLKFLFTVSRVSLKEGGSQRLPSENLQGLWVGAKREQEEEVFKREKYLERLKKRIKELDQGINEILEEQAILIAKLNQIIEAIREEDLKVRRCKLPSMLYSKLIRGENVRCPSCGKILY